jgi:hypothetical protein
MGSLPGTLKGEWVHHDVYRTCDEARAIETTSVAGKAGWRDTRAHL